MNRRGFIGRTIAAVLAWFGWTPKSSTAQFVAGDKVHLPLPPEPIDFGTEDFLAISSYCPATGKFTLHFIGTAEEYDKQHPRRDDEYEMDYSIPGQVCLRLNQKEGDECTEEDSSEA